VHDAAPTRDPPARVAVIGGGWAGCAAAVTLADAGIPVTLFEQAKTLGGRARRVAQDGIALDNGQHLLVGAYRQALAVMARVHGADRAATLFHRLPLTLRPFGAAPSRAVGFSAWNAPAPIHLLGGLLSAQGLGWTERVAVIAGFCRVARAGYRAPDEETVAQCFADTPSRAFAAFWAPLCLAALNTPPERASARMFAHVLRAAFTGSARHSDFLVPAVDLSACFPDAAGRFIASRGGTLRPGVGVRAIARSAAGVVLGVGPATEAFSAAIIAVGPHQLAATIGVEAAGDDAWRARLAQVGAFRYESITTIYVGFAGPVPFSVPLARLDDAPGQWLFDRTAALSGGAGRGAESLAAVVVSAGGPHDALDHVTLAAQVEAQLRRLEPRLPPVAWSRVIAERRATYACTPALARPAAGYVAPGLYLAGDYTDADFPATLEAACRSGIAAASALIADRGARSG
jgi:squalene-associated FAD-dependent desaturase